MTVRPVSMLLVALASLATEPPTYAQSPPKPVARSLFEAFDVATIKLSAPEDPKAGRYIRMQSAHRFQAKNYTVNGLIAAAYDLNPRAISGGPAWVESDRYEIVAATPGDQRPTYDDQMAMLRKLLVDRFNLAFHREKKEFSIYELTISKGGPKLSTSTATPDEAPNFTSTLYPAASGGIDHALLPARNVTMAQFASLLQRAILDKPVVDDTGLTSRYDFDLEWTPDETQFGGQLPFGPPDSEKPGLFAALQQQAGLKIEATRGPIGTLVIDRIERPSEN
jgi:uncharacterized protein (TIGR03435 family)